VNPQHLRAFLWLQWRLRINQLRRGGIANAVLLAVLAAGVALLAVALFVGSFLAGLFALGGVEPAVLLYVWDGVVLTFLFFWATGLLADLQRSEALSLDKFLHLPVSLTGVFVLNYLSSLFSLTLILFVPAMLGLCLGLVLSRGAALLVQLPLVIAFLLMVTAITYQFQGWLASLMVNKRRRRTVIVVVTMAFVLLAQLPNLVNLLQPWGGKQDDLKAEYNRTLADLDRARTAGEITAGEYHQRQAEAMKKLQAQRQERNLQTWQSVGQSARLINLVLPPGWLPLGVMATAEGDVVPALLGTLGLALIGVASLWRSYRTTLRLYTGQFTAGTPRSAPAPAPTAPAAKADRAQGGMLEMRLPWLSEQAAAVALAGFRSLTRAPEAKMLLLSPLILVVVFGVVFLRNPVDVPQAVRPLAAFAAISMVLLSLVQIAGNQFGFDRGGFRVLVLAPARRNDVLLGKNLALAPLALALCAFPVVLVQAVVPLRLDHFLATLAQMVSMYLLFCLLANCLSILAPMAIAAGTMKPANARVVPILLQFAFLLLLPMVLAPTLLPLGVEVLLESLGWMSGWPICLALSLAECAVVVLVYLAILRGQGAWLQAREQAILDVVTTKAE
jgi:hypothetical protein